MLNTHKCTALRSFDHMYWNTLVSWYKVIISSMQIHMNWSLWKDLEQLVSSKNSFNLKYDFLQTSHFRWHVSSFQLTCCGTVLGTWCSRAWWLPWPGPSSATRVRGHVSRVSCHGAAPGTRRWSACRTPSRRWLLFGGGPGSSGPGPPPRPGPAPAGCWSPRSRRQSRAPPPAWAVTSHQVMGGHSDVIILTFVTRSACSESSSS